MFNRLKQKIITTIQLILVLLFILFEEIIWEGIAEPIYKWVHGLRVLQTIERWLQKVNATVILVIFVVMLVCVELLGLYAGVLFVSGKPLLGATLYATKIPIAAFTFWMFHVTESKLMQFGWFAWLYEKLLAAIAWLKSLEGYQEVMKRLQKTKEGLKVWLKEMKRRYFDQESLFVIRLKRLYRAIKRTLHLD